MPVNATVNVTKVVIKRQGRKGAPGTNGTDGLGIQTVRMGKINNPVFQCFNKNRVATTLFGALSWLRATDAKLTDRYGGIKSILADFPREFFDGWKIEGDSTNVALQSQTFDNASWIKTNTSITANSTAAPDGMLTGDTVTQTVAGGTINQAVTISSDLLIKTASIYLKQGTAPTIRLRLDLTGGTTQQLDVDIAWASIDSNPNAEKVTNGWYRINVSITGNGTNTGATLSLFPDTSDASLNVIAWGGQIEQGVLSSYIETTTTAATRALDNIKANTYLNVPDISKPWNMFIKIKSDVLGGYIFEHSDSDFALSINSSSQLILTTDSGIDFTLTGTVDFSVLKSVSVTYDGANAVCFIDGVEENTSMPSFNTISTGTITYGSDSTNTNPSFCTILDLRWWDFAFNDSENEFLSGE